MITDRTLVRLRAALDEWFAVVAVALLALALLGGWAAYGSMAATDTDADRQAGAAWSTSGGFEHGATVQAENDVFPVGTELSNRSVYFTEISPELESTFRFGYDAGTGDVDVDVTAERVLRSVDDEGVEYWSVNETVAETSAQGLEPGEEHETTFSLDVPATVNETEAIEESLGGSAGTTETVVTVSVSMTGTIDGESVDRVETYELEVRPDGSTYAVSAPPANAGAAEESADEDDAVATANADSSGLLGSVGPALLAIASLCALGALVVSKATGSLAPSEAELERVRERYEREEFDDWISRGTLPDDVRNRSRIEVSTLEDLVDVAIDCDRRVLEDERSGEYYVVDGESLYVYEPMGLEDEASVGGESDVSEPGQGGDEDVVGDDLSDGSSGS